MANGSAIDVKRPPVSLIAYQQMAVAREHDNAHDQLQLAEARNGLNFRGQNAIAGLSAYTPTATINQGTFTA